MSRNCINNLKVGDVILACFVPNGIGKNGVQWKPSSSITNFMFSFAVVGFNYDLAVIAPDINDNTNYGFNKPGQFGFNSSFYLIYSDIKIIKISKKKIALMFSFIIRPANVNDAEAIATIGYNSWQDSYQDVLPKEFLSNINLQEHIQRVVIKINSGAQITIAYDDKYNAVGYCSFGNRKKIYPVKVQTEIYSIYVNRDVRSKGLGTFLLYEVERQFSMIKPTVVRILKDNVKAQKFFKDNGYRYLPGADGIFQNLAPDVSFLKIK